ncbi:MAG: hypothetical protein M1839_001610 [Geoglossum umbratile]|nr:MAG: hypothetical protein M1839_001610 [Geoglossum umbratile]
MLPQEPPRIKPNSIDEAREALRALKLPQSVTTFMGIENSPLQAYVSALVFSPASSLIRGLFKEEEPVWITTLEGHSSALRSVAFSHDSARLASASYDHTVKIWDASSGQCLQTLKGHSGAVGSVTFSHDSAWLASASSDSTVKIWDVGSGKCLQTLEGHSDSVHSIWDTSGGECLQTLSIGKALSNILIDITGSYLYTETGTIVVDASTTSSVTPNVTGPQGPRYKGWGLSSDGVWITYDSENLVWLHSEYRPSCLAVSGNTIGIGTGSGRVWICNFNVDNPYSFLEGYV